MRVLFLCIIMLSSNIVLSQTDKEAYNAVRIAMVQSSCLICEDEAPRIFNVDSLRIAFKAQNDDEILEIALKKYATFAENFPKSVFVTKALMQKASLETYFHRYENAKTSLENILKTETKPDPENIFHGPDYDKGKAAFRLAKIAISENNFPKAVEYLDQCKTFKKYQCGNDAENTWEEFKKLYAICQTELKQKK